MESEFIYLKKRIFKFKKYKNKNSECVSNSLFEFAK